MTRAPWRPGALVGLAALLLPLATGCTQHLAFATGTTFGLKATMVEQGQQEVTIGYKRIEATRFPVRKAVTDKRQRVVGQTYSVLGQFFVRNHWALVDWQKDAKFGVGVCSLFATGNAAITAATHLPELESAEPLSDVCEWGSSTASTESPGDAGGDGPANDGRE